MDRLSKVREAIASLRGEVHGLVELCVKYEAENKRMQELIKHLLEELEDVQDRNGRLMNEFIQVLDERDTLHSKFEVSQGMRRDEHERHTKENAKWRDLVDELWALAYGYVPDESELDAARDMMRELGIKEDA